jgi:hypothetical protein
MIFCAAATAQTGSGQTPLQAYSDLIEFTNKDKMHGNLVGIAQGQFGVKWENASLEKAIAFSMAKISKIQLGKRQGATEPEKGSAVRLTNDDQIRGQVVSLDANSLVINTSFAGKMTITRKMLKSINPNQAAGSAIFEGPTDLASWTIGQGGNQKSWTFKDDTLMSYGRFPIGRFLDSMPDAFEISFDVAWSGYPNFNFMFLVDNLQYPDNGGYGLNTSGSTVYLYKYSRTHGSRSTGDNVSIERFNNGRATKASYKLLVSKENKVIVLLIDGQVMKQWSETAGLSGTGKGISFYPNGQGLFKVSNIKVSSWDGKIPQAGSSGGAQKEDLVKLSNNDKVSGTVKTITGDQIKFEASYATMDIPLNRVVEISFSTERAEKAALNKDDVRASFATGGAITVQMSKLENGKIEGKSDNFGTVSMPLAAFRQLDFNIYEKPEPEPKPGSSEGEAVIDDFVE